MSIRSVLCAALLLTACDSATKPPEPAAAESRPNLLVVEVDDLDQPMFDLMLEDGWLPNIRTHLVDDGVVFTNSFVSDAVCCPSRATYLTGQYANNHGILGVSKGVAYWYYGGDNREPHALPVLLHDAGYTTAHIGKYLNGYGMFNRSDHVPPGYDAWYGLLDPYTYDVYRWKQNVTVDGETRIIDHSGEDGPYQTDALRDQALSFLDDVAEPGKPFYLAFKPVAPHVETRSFRDSEALGFRATFREWIRPAPRHECLIRPLLGKDAKTESDADSGLCERELPDSLAFLRERPSFNEIDTGKPDTIRERVEQLTQEGGDFRALERQHQSRMASMIAVDDAIGAIVDRLKAQGRWDSTLVVFTSDNGYFHGEHRLDSKLLPYEESIRVPLVVRPPGGAEAPSVPAIALNNDLAPTLADYGGASPQREKDRWDGRSLKPWLEGESPAWRRQVMVEHFIELTVLELAREKEWFGKLTDAVVALLEKGAGFELGALRNMAYPAYKAVRRIDPETGENALYVQWYSNLRNVEPEGWETDFEEFYDLTDDPWQRQNLLADEEPPKAVAKRIESFRSALDQLKTCDAEACVEAENR